MNVLRVELVREVGKLKTYKITYNEDIEFETTLVGKTFNYGEGIDAVKQYMYWTEVNVKNLLGDRKLHRWRKGKFKRIT